jgi:3-hydroxyisobutyrate dehydrogenase
MASQNSDLMRPRVAALGLGTMGSACARRLLGAGWTVDVWDRISDTVLQLAERGARAHTDPRNAVALSPANQHLH